MEKIVERLASYHLFNYVLPGFLVLLCYFYLSDLSNSSYNLVVLFVLAYFCGLFISRVGSLILEPTLKKTGFIRFAKIEEYINATKKDAKIETLMETANMYRSLIVVSLFAVVLASFLKVDYVLIIAGGISFIVFLFSYRKQIGYIVARVEGAENAKK